MKVTAMTRAHTLTLDETLNRLMRTDEVDGIAFFGSRADVSADPVSDYDLLILVRYQPVSIFQMLTHISSRMADIVFSDVDTAERVMTINESVQARSAEGMLMQKVHDAHIVYDPSRRLERVQQHLNRRADIADWLIMPTDSDKYAVWFWQNHGLLHVKRMIQSDNPLYLTAAELMLLNGLADICRSYYCVHELFWQGEKAALKYLQAHDPDYLALLQRCMAEPDRFQKVALFEQLVAKTLAPVGTLWHPGITAVYLRDTSKQPELVEEALLFWEGLLDMSN